MGAFVQIAMGVGRVSVRVEQLTKCLKWPYVHLAGAGSQAVWVGTFLAINGTETRALFSVPDAYFKTDPELQPT